MSDEFEAAASWLSSNPGAATLPNDVKLEIYGLFKYINTGSGPTDGRPSMFSMTARAKYDAWVSQSKTYSADLEAAKERYTSIAREIGWDGDVSSKSSSGPMGGVRVSTMAPPVEETGNGEGEGEGSSKLHDAVIDGNEGMVRRLIKEEKIPVDTRDEYGLTSLHIAADRGNIELVKLLLELGADRDIMDEDDQTPLMLAEAVDREDIVALLR